MGLIYKIIENNDQLCDRAAEWFAQKWRINKGVYLKSMCSSVQGGVPQWFVALDGENIVAGLGIIENDFHERVDLSPNICAVYVEKEYRSKGVAGDLLNLACGYLAANGCAVAYVVADIIGFYERYGFEFVGEVKCDFQDYLSRIYARKLI